MELHGRVGDILNAVDSYGPTLNDATIAGLSSSSLLIHFVADPNDPSYFGFALDPFFGPQGYVDVSATGSRSTTFSFAATDVMGNQYTGVGSLSVVPEPVSMVLLGTGLLGIAGARRRRKGAA